MAELKVPNLNYGSRQFLFKNKLTIRRKSRTRLLRESLLMFFSSFILLFLINLIPQKNFLILTFVDNIYKIYLNFLNFFNYFYKIILVIIIFLTLILALFLLIGAFYRLYRILRKSTKRIKY